MIKANMIYGRYQRERIIARLDAIRKIRTIKITQLNLVKYHCWNRIFQRGCQSFEAC